MYEQVDMDLNFTSMSQVRVICLPLPSSSSTLYLVTSDPPLSFGGSETVVLIHRQLKIERVLEMRETGLTLGRVA